MSRRLQEIGEHGWIRRLLAGLPAGGPSLRIGPGDDAAALRVGGRTLLLTVDALVEGVHFRRAWLTPRALGARAYRVSASDVAAMGGRPIAMLVAVEAPRATPVALLDGIVAGCVAAARSHGAMLVGGNVARASRLALTVAVAGVAGPRLVTRAGARPGDDVWVTGALGATATAVRDRLAGRRTPLPTIPNRIDAGRRLASVATAMIDVSDGLVADLGHVARASGVAIRLEADAVPVTVACRRRFGPRAALFAATAGEDYELACTVPPRRRRALDRVARRLGCPLTRVGTVVRGRPGVTVVDASGASLALVRRGYDHLR